MIAIGCLAPLILLAAGAFVGNAIDGPTAALWGAGIGFAVGIVALAALAWISEKLKA